MDNKTTESAGDKLGRLLKKGEQNHADMRALFLKNNLTTMDLALLPTEDRAEWQRLRALNDLLTTEMSVLIESMT